MIIPARRMMIMIINAKPRHTANCGTDRTSPTVVVVVKALLPELATVGSVFPPSALKHADSAPLTWAWLWCESRGLGQLEREREYLRLTKSVHASLKARLFLITSSYLSVPAQRLHFPLWCEPLLSQEPDHRHQRHWLYILASNKKALNLKQLM